MSDTKIDMPKVCQMLDAGWEVNIYRGGIGGYVAAARHKNHSIWNDAKINMYHQIAKANHSMDASAIADIIAVDFCEPGLIDTEDFTPEQALTRLAYKVHGEII